LNGDWQRRNKKNKNIETRDSSESPLFFDAGDPAEPVRGFSLTGF
jgi:hypothetical protein